MKRNLLILIFALPIFIWQGVKGQQYQQVVYPNSSVWLIAHSQLAGRFVDTLFAKDVSNNETELWYKFSDSQLIFIGNTISDTSNSKLYFKPSQIISQDTTFKLIFDLNLAVGDTYSFGNYIDTVASVFTLNGKKHIEFKNSNTNWGEKVRFVEGVGPNTGVFVNYLGILNPFVACKHELDSIVYVTQNVNFNGCNLSTQIQENDLEFLIEVYPNPFSDFIEIRSNLLDTKTMVSIINITGQKLFESEINSEIFIIPTNNLLPGIYFVNIQSKNEKLTKKIIKL